MTAFCSFGAFWMSLGIWGTLVSAGIFTGVEKGEQMMLAIWGCIVSAAPPAWPPARPLPACLPGLARPAVHHACLQAQPHARP